MGDDVALLVDDEDDRYLAGATRGEQTHGVGGGTVGEHCSLGGPEARGVERNGVLASTSVQDLNGFMVPRTVGEDFQ